MSKGKQKQYLLRYSLFAAFVTATYFTSDLGRPDFLNKTPVSKNKFQNCRDLWPHDMPLPEDINIRNEFVVKTILRGMECARRSPSKKLPSPHPFAFRG